MADGSSYSNVRERLDEIVTQVRSRDVPLEKSLDLFEEALELGTRCAELIDRTDFSTDELEAAGFSKSDTQEFEAVVIGQEDAGDDADEGTVTGTADDGADEDAYGDAGEDAYGDASEDAYGDALGIDDFASDPDEPYEEE